MPQDVTGNNSEASTKTPSLSVLGESRSLTLPVFVATLMTKSRHRKGNANVYYDF